MKNICILIALLCSYNLCYSQNCDSLYLNVDRFIDLKNPELWRLEFSKHLKDSIPIKTVVDSIIKYQELMLVNKCSNFYLGWLSELAEAYFEKGKYDKALLYSNKLLGTNTIKLYHVGGKIISEDTLLYAKFKGLKTKALVFDQNKIQDSLLAIISQLDSFKLKYCWCSSCFGKENFFINKLKTNYFVRTNQIDTALFIWKRSSFSGNHEVNSIIIELLKRKYPKGKLSKITLYQFTKHGIIFDFKDDIIKGIRVPCHECNNINTVLAENPYLRFCSRKK